MNASGSGMSFARAAGAFVVYGTRFAACDGMADEVANRPSVGTNLLDRHHQRRPRSVTIARISTLVVFVSASLMAMIAYRAPVLVSGAEHLWRSPAPTTASAPVAVFVAVVAIGLAVLAAWRPSKARAIALVVAAVMLAAIAVAYRSPVAFLLGPMEVCHGHFDQYCARFAVPHAGLFITTAIQALGAALVASVAVFSTKK